MTRVRVGVLWAASRRYFAARATFALLLALAATLLSRGARAHTASDGYLTLTFSEVGAIDGRWDLALRDLDAAITLDPDHPGNGEIHAAQVRARTADIMAFALSHLTIRGDGASCTMTPGDLTFTDHGGQIYVSLRFTAACPTNPRVVALDYEIFFDKDPLHRGMTRIDDGPKSRSILFSAGFRREEITRREEGRGDELYAAVRSGIGHIAGGTDHLLFLLALLLPAVLRREKGSWRPVKTFREALVEVAKIVTAFTAAHSLTLSLAVLGVVRLPPHFVEPAIAASILFAALENVVRPRDRGRWRVAFALGLLHGFGFSAALTDLGLRKSDLLTTLFGFNVGVEIGQLAVVAVFLPIAFRLRGWSRYPAVVLGGGSVVVAIVALVWFVQRALASTSVQAHAFSGSALVRPTRAGDVRPWERGDHRLLRV